MKAIIDSTGNLHLSRGGRMKEQNCPFGEDSAEYVTPCGDWCPLFREPDYFARDVTLNLCRAVLVIRKDDFEDKRRAKGE